MEGTPQGEQAHDEGLAVAAYERMLQLARQDAELPIDECARQALTDYPDQPRPTQQGHKKSETALELKFRHFARTLLGTSADIEVFNERASFLYSPAFSDYYTVAVRQSVDKRLVHYNARAIDIGVEGLTDFCEAHPEDQAEALDYMAIAFAPQPGSKSAKASVALANIIQTDSAHFRDQIRGGYFQDVPHTLKQVLAAECLARLGFGDTARAIGDAAIHGAIYAPLSIEGLYHLRNFNSWLTQLLEHRQRGEPLKLEGYEGSKVARLDSDAYEMLRRAASYVAELGSQNAAAILEGLPELVRGQPPGRSRVIALANHLTPLMNEAYFKNEFVLDRLDSQSDEAQLHAFDRILYVLHQELPRSGAEETDEKHRTILTLTGNIISGMIDLVYLKMDARNPVTIGDIITMYPDADPETLQTIVEGMQSRFNRKRNAPTYGTYLEYRDQVRKKRNLDFEPKRPGHGIIS